MANTGKRTRKHTLSIVNKPKSEGGNLDVLTPMKAKELAALSNKVQAMRKQMRAKLLESAINEGIDRYYIKALQNLDPEAITVVEKALKIVGLDFSSSDEAPKSGLSVKASASDGSTGQSEPSQLNVAIEVVDGCQA